AFEPESVVEPRPRRIALEALQAYGRGVPHRLPEQRTQEIVIEHGLLDLAVQAFARGDIGLFASLGYQRRQDLGRVDPRVVASRGWAEEVAIAGVAVCTEHRELQQPKLVLVRQDLCEPSLTLQHLDPYFDADALQHRLHELGDLGIGVPLDRAERY